ncbi:hypothetical protein WME73_18535 [Sorangium sp. So ce302]|uniref:hypothetical protein n=1 Tax=unclassified Sorangium TaxID=2621164 RepID=UPI003F622D41
MSLFSKRVLPLTFLGAAALLGGCVGEAPLEGDGETQPDVAAADPESADAIDPDAAEEVGAAQQALTRLTTWHCWAFNWNPMAGQVTIWWGHTQTDALWACNQWIADCRRGGGDCVTAKQVNELWVQNW